MDDSVDARMVEAAARAIDDAIGSGVATKGAGAGIAPSVLAALQPFRDAEQAETREQAAMEVRPEPAPQPNSKDWRVSHPDGEHYRYYDSHREASAYAQGLNDYSQRLAEPNA